MRALTSEFGHLALHKSIALRWECFNGNVFTIVNTAWRGRLQRKKIKRKNRYGRTNYRLVVIPQAVPMADQNAIPKGPTTSNGVRKADACGCRWARTPRTLRAGEARQRELLASQVPRHVRNSLPLDGRRPPHGAAVTRSLGYGGDDAVSEAVTQLP